VTAQGDYQCEVPQNLWPPRDPNHGERYLNSAYWPEEKRPDIADYAIGRYGYEYENRSSHLPHYCFLLDAEAVGYPISHTPKVGDLWVAPCDKLALEGSGFDFECGDAGATDWFLGYVEKVFQDGSFIQSWGGSSTPADSGLSLTWFSSSMDAYTEFIHLMPEPPPQFLTGTLSAAAVGQPYAAQLVATGGTKPLTWSIAAYFTSFPLEGPAQILSASRGLSSKTYS
jgi:hypothetical protein